jgi:hypothetical protein
MKSAQEVMTAIEGIEFVRQIEVLEYEYKRLTEEHGRVLKAIKILLHAAGEESTCRGCPTTIWWVHHLNGKTTPYDVDGTNHFVTCPASRNFRKAPATTGKGEEHP